MKEHERTRVKKVGAILPTTPTSIHPSIHCLLPTRSHADQRTEMSNQDLKKLKRADSFFWTFGPLPLLAREMGEGGGCERDGGKNKPGDRLDPGQWCLSAKTGSERSVRGPGSESACLCNCLLTCFNSSAIAISFVHHPFPCQLSAVGSPLSRTKEEEGRGVINSAQMCQGKGQCWCECWWNGLACSFVGLFACWLAQCSRLEGAAELLASYSQCECVCESE